MVDLSGEGDRALAPEDSDRDCIFYIQSVYLSSGALRRKEVVEFLSNLELVLVPQEFLGFLVIRVAGPNIKSLDLMDLISDESTKDSSKVNVLSPLPTVVLHIPVLFKVVALLRHQKTNKSTASLKTRKFQLTQHSLKH